MEPTTLKVLIADLESYRSTNGGRLPVSLQAPDFTLRTGLYAEHEKLWTNSFPITNHFLLITNKVYADDHSNAVYVVIRRRPFSERHLARGYIAMYPTGNFTTARHGRS